MVFFGIWFFRFSAQAFVFVFFGSWEMEEDGISRKKVQRDKERQNKESPGPGRELLEKGVSWEGRSGGPRKGGEGSSLLHFCQFQAFGPH